MDAGGRAEYFKEELEASSMFPRRFTDPAEISHAIVFLLENSMMNAFHVSDMCGRVMEPADPSLAQGGRRMEDGKHLGRWR